MNSSQQPTLPRDVYGSTLKVFERYLACGIQHGVHECENHVLPTLVLDGARFNVKYVNRLGSVIDNCALCLFCK